MARCSELGTMHGVGRTVVRTMASTLPMATLVVGAGLSAAAPTPRSPANIAAKPGITSQPGTTSPTQPGATGPRPPHTQPGPPRAYAKRPGPPVDAPPASSTGYSPPRRVSRPRDTAPADVQKPHVPRPIPQVAPIVPPLKIIRIGGFTTPAPPYIPEPVVNQINAAAADAEAGIDTLIRGIGVPPNRSDRIAAAAIGGAVVGAVAAGLAAVLLTGAAGAVVGALIGTGIGAAIVLIPSAGIATPLLPQSMAAGALLGAITGAALPAALIALPAATAGTLAGGLIGTYLGSITPDPQPQP